MGIRGSRTDRERPATTTFTAEDLVVAAGHPHGPRYSPLSARARRAARAIRKMTVPVPTIPAAVAA